MATDKHWKLADRSAQPVNLMQAEEKQLESADVHELTVLMYE